MHSLTGTGLPRKRVLTARDEPARGRLSRPPPTFPSSRPAVIKRPPSLTSERIVIRLIGSDTAGRKRVEIYGPRVGVVRHRKGASRGPKVDPTVPRLRNRFRILPDRERARVLGITREFHSADTGPRQLSSSETKKR